MRVRVFADEAALGRAAAARASELVRDAIRAGGKARVLAAAGESQRALFDALVATTGLAWGNVELFHDREYLGLTSEHPASCRRFLCDRLVSRTPVGRCHLLDGQREPERVCRDEGDALRADPIDVAMAALGEGGELAWNFAPADFALERPFLVVRLDEAWRQRHAGRDGFATLAEVPERAITISIRQLLKASALIVCAPGGRHAAAVKRCVEGAVSPLAPASILQTHSDATLFLDKHSAALLSEPPPLEI